MGAVGDPGVPDGCFLHDSLDFAQGELLAALGSRLHPQGDDAGGHGGGHRGARHQSVGAGGVVHDNVAHVAVGDEMVEGRDDVLARGRNPGVNVAQRTTALDGIARETRDIAHWA